MSTSLRISPHFFADDSWLADALIDDLVYYMISRGWGYLVTTKVHPESLDFAFEFLTNDERLARLLVARAFGDCLPEWEYTVEKIEFVPDAWNILRHD